MSEKSSSATLRITTDNSDVDFISKALNVTASREHRKGDRLSKNNPLSSVFEQSLWLYDSPFPDNLDLEVHIDAILQLLECRQEQLELIRTRITAVDIVCMFSAIDGQGSAALTHPLLERLASQRLNLMLDLYPPSRSDEG
jgi:hypothetical protein